MDNKRKLRRLLVFSTAYFVGFIFLIFVLVELRELILPTILGGLLAYLFKPLLTSFTLTWLPKQIKVSLILLVLFFAIFNLYKFIKNQVPNKAEQIELMVRAQYKLNKKYQSIMGLSSAENEERKKGNLLNSLFSKEMLPIIDQINSWLSLTPQQQKSFIDYYNKNDLLDHKYYAYFTYNQRNYYTSQVHHNAESTTTSKDALTTDTENTSFLSRLIETLSTWLVLPFVFIFLLFDNGQISKYFIRRVPNRYFELSLTVLDEVDQALGKYLRGTLLECGLVGLTLAVGLFLIGIDVRVSFGIGLIAGLSNAIPFLGPVIGLVVGLGYALIAENITPILPMMSSDSVFLGVFIAVGIAQLLDNTIFQPIVLGSAVNLHPLVVIIGVMGGSTIFGFEGMLLAIPTIVVVNVVIETLFREMKAYKII